MEATFNMTATKIPSFRIHKADGSIPDTLINAFVLKRDITEDDLKAGFILLQDDSCWRIVTENHGEILEALENRISCYCIISFQAHAHGNFAVTRMFKPEKPNKTKNSTVKTNRIRS